MTMDEAVKKFKEDLAKEFLSLYSTTKMEWEKAPEFMRNTFLLRANSFLKAHKDLYLKVTEIESPYLPKRYKTEYIKLSSEEAK